MEYFNPAKIFYISYFLYNSSTNKSRQTFKTDNVNLRSVLCHKQLKIDPTVPEWEEGLVNNKLISFI